MRCNKHFSQLIKPLLFQDLEISFDFIPRIANMVRKDTSLAGQVRSLHVKEWGYWSTVENWSSDNEIVEQEPEADDEAFTETIAADLEYLLLQMSRSDARPGLQSFKWDLDPGYDMPSTGVPAGVWHALAGNARSIRHIDVKFSREDGEFSVLP